MKIHSDFRDYYDHVTMYGADPLLHYNRHGRRFYPSELNHSLPENWLERVWWGERELCGKRLTRFIVGFCGTLHLGTQVDSEYIYSRERLAALLPINPEWHKYHADRRAIRNLLDLVEPIENQDPIFLQVEAPIFLVECDYPQAGRRDREVYLTTNASLREKEFAKVKDPFTAFQEVSMYLGNQLVKHDQPDTIADEYRIAMHGFDKHSFRHPTRIAHLAR